MRSNAMRLNEYQDKAMTTNAASSDNETYSLFGLIAEVGEIADKVAKGVRKELIQLDNNFIYEGRNAVVDATTTLEYVEFEEGMKKELGDVLWFVAHLAHRFGWSLDEVAQLNLDKVADRAKRGVIVGNGDNR